MSKRISRVNKLLKEQISQLLIKEIDFGDSCLVTITQVEATGNLQEAKVKITVMPQEKSAVVLKTLEKNIYHLQQLINKRLNMRPVPKIIFEMDRAEIKAQRIEELLSQIKPKIKT